MKLKILVMMCFLVMFSCKKAEDSSSYSVDSTAESGQQVGDAMASVDEAGGSTNGSFSQMEQIEFKHAEKTFARLTSDEPQRGSSLLQLALPEAQAAVCSLTGFSSCSANQKIKDFADCSTPGGGTLSGTVTLSFTGTGAATCTIPMNNDAVSRVPSFSITGLRGATFAVSATSTGQTITRVNATDFTFSNSGIRRTFVTPKGSTILDVTSSTASPITISGTTRANRVMTGGGLTITNNLTSVSCTLAPSAVAWEAGCNCPTSGSWSGSCSDATSMSVAFSGTCGQATVTKGADSSTITMDRCQ